MSRNREAQELRRLLDAWRTVKRAIAEDVQANVGLIFVASIAVSAAFGSWLGGLS